MLRQQQQKILKFQCGNKITTTKTRQQQISFSGLTMSMLCIYCFSQTTLTERITFIEQQKHKSELTINSYTKCKNGWILTNKINDEYACFFSVRRVCKFADKNLHSIFYSEIVPYSINRISTMKLMCVDFSHKYTPTTDNSNHYEQRNGTDWIPCRNVHIQSSLTCQCSVVSTVCMQFRLFRFLVGV